MKIAFLGDMVVDQRVQVDPAVSFFLKKADYVIANLEGIILDSGACVPPYKTYGSVIYNDHASVMRLIDEVGVTHVNVYNNHMIDFGEKQFERTLDILLKAGIRVLTPENEFRFEGGSVHLINSGLVETFGIHEVSSSFGLNVNDMLFEDNRIERWGGAIIHTHFGVEQVAGLSKYECQWFDCMARSGASIIVRHHPHCVQEPFQLHGVPCFPSIGDFAFNFKRKTHSKGMAVMFDAITSEVECRALECSQYRLQIGSEQINIKPEAAPVLLSKLEVSMLRKRYRDEYREDGVKSFKKAVKYIMGKEKTEHVLSMSSKHFIQPYVLGEIL